MRYPFLCPGFMVVSIKRSEGTHLTASREERAIQDVPPASAPALPVTTHHLPTPTDESTHRRAHLFILRITALLDAVLVTSR